MLDFFFRLFDTSDFPERWSCGNWSSAHGWVHVTSDAAIFGAYVAIPIALVYFVRRSPELPFPRIFWLFGAFILACGTGHLIEATIFWHPWYRLSGMVKFMTAIVSWVTVIALVRSAPAVIRLATADRRHDQLRAEVSQREAAEAELREVVAQAERANRDLERINRTMLDREGRVLDLKREVNELLGELGRSARYRSVAEAL